MLALATTLRPGHLDAVRAWPPRHGGGRQGAAVLVATVCAMMATPFALARRREGDMQQLQEVGGRKIWGRDAG